jgi:LacI family transcriptional regulator
MKNPAVRKPTQFDVARKAGVSQTTVSRILNNSSMVSIPEETRQRVLLAMEELSYIPDLTARSLRTSKTYTIAAIIPDITNPYYPTFVRGIQDVAEENAYDLVIYNTDGDENKERHSLKSVAQNRVDGLIVVPFHISPEELLQINIPTIQLTQKPLEPPNLDSIYIDNVAAAFTIVQHLIDRGYMRIGMIAGEEDTPPRKNRILGYQNAIALHHIPLDEVLVRGGDFTEAGGYVAMQELLKVNPRVDAVFAANDLMAMGALIAIREANLQVPADIAVAGMDDIPAARLVCPPLTTITQYQQNIGRKAAEMLFERLTDGSVEDLRSVEMPFSLIVREST